MKLESSHGGHEIYSYRDTPMKRIYRQLAQNWSPIMGGQEPPDFDMMRDIAFSEHDITQDEQESFVNPSMDQFKPPTGHGGMKDDPHTAHFLGGVLNDIHPDLANLYHGGHHNNREKVVYHDNIPTPVNVEIISRYY